MIAPPDLDPIQLDPPPADDPSASAGWLAPLAGKPLEVDIGCGNGRFLAAMAAENPEIHFLGIERRRDRVRKTVRKAERRGLRNLWVVRLEAEYVFAHLLPENSVRRVYLFFPDPWPKRRHHKRRLFSPLFVDSLFRTLRPGGTLEVVTDHGDYFARIEALLSADERFVAARPMVRDAGKQTDFERIFLEKGIPFHSRAFAKKPEGSPRAK